MTLRRHVVTALTDGSGDATVYSPYISGTIVSIAYVKTDYTDGVDFAITVDGTGQGIWSESNVNAAVVKYPRAATHSVAGVASLYAGSGTAVNGRIGISRDRVKIVIAQGGAAHTGAFHIVVDE